MRLLTTIAPGYEEIAPLGTNRTDGVVKIRCPFLLAGVLYAELLIMIWRPEKLFVTVTGLVGFRLACFRLPKCLRWCRH